MREGGERGRKGRREEGRGGGRGEHALSIHFSSQQNNKDTSPQSIAVGKGLDRRVSLDATSQNA